jgi:drug/metabolite transporter (DMT)-like permease
MLLAGLAILCCVLFDTLQHLCYKIPEHFKTGQALWTALGISLHVAGMIAWFWLLGTVPLGIALPLMGASYVTIAIASSIIFKEQVNRTRWLGILMVAGGVLLIGKAAL